jgi:general secretion pathway protein K
MLGQKKQSGVALLVVLWGSILLTVLVTGFAHHSQESSMLSRRAIDRLQVIETAKAGLELAVRQLQHPDLQQRLWADGRPYRIKFEGVELVIRVQDEKGKIGINNAGADTLVLLFKSVGIEQELATRIADSVIDYRDEDDATRLYGAETADYHRAGLPYGAKNNSFITLEELLQVYGINYDLYQKIVPALSIYASSPQPDWRLAPKAVLAMEPTLDVDFIELFLKARHAATSAGEVLPAWPDGRQFTAYQGSGPIYTINIEATLANQAIRQITAVVHTEENDSFFPFSIKHWSER